MPKQPYTPPTPFLPSGPDTLYASLLARTPPSVDVSAYWSHAWCQFVGDDQKRTKLTEAMEMRWFLREWRARNYAEAFEVSERINI